MPVNFIQIKTFSLLLFFKLLHKLSCVLNPRPPSSICRPISLNFAPRIIGRLIKPTISSSISLNISTSSWLIMVELTNFRFLLIKFFLLLTKHKIFIGFSINRSILSKFIFNRRCVFHNLRIHIIFIQSWMIGCSSKLLIKFG